MLKDFVTWKQEGRKIINGQLNYQSINIGYKALAKKCPGEELYLYLHILENLNC